jgi:2-polyprenyl-3-methyl-5-hydroxy-6-metoxy-1,4-benzoquinol methylase
MIKNINTKEEENYYKNTRLDIASLIPGNVDRIFEVGCGSGNTLDFLKKTGVCKWAGGIELFKDAAHLAQKKEIDLIIEGNINDYELKIDIGSIDIILCLDVLEHLVDPWSVMEKLYKYLKPGGVIICSIPNVANFRVLVPLIFKNEWSYTKSGLLDFTHLRFFTAKSAKALVNQSGFTVDKINVTGLEAWSKGAIANYLTLGIFKRFLIYQFLIRGCKKID